MRNRILRIARGTFPILLMPIAAPALAAQEPSATPVPAKPPAAATTSTAQPMILVDIWRIAPQSPRLVQPGQTEFVANQSPSSNRPEDVEALLPGSKPQSARFVGMYAKNGEWSTVSFNGSSDTMSGIIEHSNAPPTLHLIVHVDGKQLPECVIPLASDRTGSGLVLAGAPDGMGYAVGANVMLMAPERD